MVLLRICSSDNASDLSTSWNSRVWWILLGHWLNIRGCVVEGEDRNEAVAK
ncbi:hypothetical protein A2U01_0090859 [Trifolium medium]|uniref:Uncharacterized protein n=1 Tax=Trifolium medium TaxID=97028 RepID=A0A392UB04_9FABA|nr:hypothetical protein [Trifolium medium]